MDYRFLRAQGCSWIYLMEGSVRFGFMEKKFRLVWCSVQSTISCFDYKWWPDPSVMRTTANNPFNHSSSSLHLCKYLPFNFFHILALWLWIFRSRRQTNTSRMTWSRFDWDEYDWASGANKKWSVVFWKNDRQLPWWAQQKPEWWCLDH